MPPRNSLPAGERAARSELARLLHAGAPLLRGSVSRSARKCGKPTCRCARGGEPHWASYLSVRHEGRRKSIHVPPDLEDRVREAVENGRRAERAIDAISQSFLKELLRLKKRPHPR